MELLTDARCISNRDRGLDDHDGIRIVFDDQFNDRLNRRRVKEILPTVIIRRRCNNNKLRITVSSLCIQRCRQIQFLFCKVFLNILILDRGLSVVDQFHLLRNDIHRRNGMVLCQQCGNGKSYIAGSCNCNLHILYLPLVFLKKQAPKTWILLAFSFKYLKNCNKKIPGTNQESS